ncbi:MAG: hypothetical protein MUF48_18380, partial [Pirellulaceae bacterium]|nr:hypothetical protein [Pirellulaceae bacterium]
EYEKARPSSPVVSFAQFESEMRAPRQIGYFALNGKYYLEWKGPRMRWCVLPSGSPSYVFDDKGFLVDWTFDDGDDPAYRARWGNFGGWTPTTTNDAKRRWSKLRSTWIAEE